MDSANRRRILVVDDDDIHRMGIRDRLEAHGYEVESAEGGAQALALVKNTTFDLIILDLLMPRPDGFEVFGRLRELSVTRCTPVLIMTVLGLEPQVQALVTQGAHYIQKREAPRKLVPVIAEIFRKRAAAAGLEGEVI